MSTQLKIWYLQILTYNNNVVVAESSPSHTVSANKLFCFLAKHLKDHSADFNMFKMFWMHIYNWLTLEPTQFKMAVMVNHTEETKLIIQLPEKNNKLMFSEVDEYHSQG